MKEYDEYCIIMISKYKMCRENLLSLQRKMLDDDINALFDSGLEEELFSGLTPNKAPPPYPGTPGMIVLRSGVLKHVLHMNIKVEYLSFNHIAVI